MILLAAHVAVALVVGSRRDAGLYLLVDLAVDLALQRRRRDAAQPSQLDAANVCGSLDCVGGTFALVAPTNHPQR